MEVKLRGLDRYEVEAIQYDGTNSDEICQFILEYTNRGSVPEQRCGQEDDGGYRHSVRRRHFGA